MQLHEIKAPKGANKRKRIIGRGPGSGSGKTAGRGENGQGSREGRSGVRGFDGGQIRLIRRLPKVGFRSHRPVVYQLVQLRGLEKIKAGTVVDAEYLRKNRYIKNVYKPYKILGNSELKNSITCQAYSFSKSAKEKIEKAGGKAEVIDAKKIKEQVNSKKSQ